jgi:hypothetical protein
MRTAHGEILQGHVQHQAYVSDLGGGEIFEDGDEVEQLVVVSI